MYEGLPLDAEEIMYKGLPLDADEIMYEGLPLDDVSVDDEGRLPEEGFPEENPIDEGTPDEGFPAQLASWPTRHGVRHNQLDSLLKVTRISIMVVTILVLLPLA